MNKKEFLHGYTERKMPVPGKKYWIGVLWTKGRTCRWTVTHPSDVFARDSAMLQKHVIGTATTPVCLNLQVFDELGGVVYSISTEDFYRHGTESRGQSGCPVRYWTVERVNAEQPRMDFGIGVQRVEH